MRMQNRMTMFLILSERKERVRKQLNESASLRNGDNNEWPPGKNSKIFKPLWVLDFPIT
jgi:hypothetical protein